MRILFLMFVFLCPLLVLAQNSQELMVKYDEAFYAGNYEQALSLVEQLVAMDSQNCLFFREKAKMQAMMRILENPAGRSDLIRPLYETELRAQ